MDVSAGEPVLAPQADSRRLGQVIASISHRLSAERIGRYRSIGDCTSQITLSLHIGAIDLGPLKSELTGHGRA